MPPSARTEFHLDLPTSSAGAGLMTRALGAVWHHRPLVRAGLAYHRTGGVSNGRVENTHMLAEEIRRNAYGFTNHIATGVDSSAKRP